ncbi:MAG: hypothetical protein WBM66_02540 [Thiothrix litoralis]
MQFWQHLLLGVALAVSALPANAISVAASNWSHTLADNITNAGDYYPDSTNTSTTVNISSTSSSSQAWTLAIHLTSAVPGLTVAVRRTGTGAGDSIPAGGDALKTVTTAYQDLFTGTGNVNNIPLEFVISGLDVTDGNGTKDIQIEYQVTTTP